MERPTPPTPSVSRRGQHSPDTCASANVKYLGRCAGYNGSRHADPADIVWEPDPCRLRREQVALRDWQARPDHRAGEEGPAGRLESRSRHRSRSTCRSLPDACARLADGALRVHAARHLGSCQACQAAWDQGGPLPDTRRAGTLEGSDERVCRSDQGPPSIAGPWRYRCRPLPRRTWTIWDRGRLRPRCRRTLP